MVHYHGGPFSDPVTAVIVWRGRHAMISFARPDQIRTAAISMLSTALNFRFLGQVQKFHRSLVDQRKGGSKGN